MSKLVALSLQQQIDRLIPTLKQYIPNTCERIDDGDGTQITQVMIRGFNGIVATCKEELEDADEEHLKYILDTMCKINVDQLSAQELYQKTDDFISRYINPSKGMSDDVLELNERNLVTMIQLKEYGQNTIKALTSLLNTLQKSRWSRWKNKDELKQIQAQHVELRTLLDALNGRLEIDADAMIERIVNNFYMIFIFLQSLSKLTKFQCSIISKIEVLAQIDRILYIIDSSLQGSALKSQYLLYYHVIFELKDFRHTLLLEM